MLAVTGRCTVSRASLKESRTVDEALEGQRDTIAQPKQYGVIKGSASLSVHAILQIQFNQSPIKLQHVLAFILHALTYEGQQTTCFLYHLSTCVTNGVQPFRSDVFV